MNRQASPAGVWEQDLGRNRANHAPLTPLSDNEFVWAGSNRLTFFKDPQGRVTHFEVVFVEGNLVGRRISEAR